ncbi:MAG: beta-lactamase family protein [Bdellovibrionales bacterium]|nr:beta-lactamase family protein [Bdellovibrionales bacterium]
MRSSLLGWIEKKVGAGIYAGAVALVSVKGELAQAAIGTMGRELDEPITMGAIFSLESISKVLCTAPLVLLLAEKNQMGLDVPLQQWLPEFRTPEKKNITARQILSHCSGLPDTDDVTLDISASPQSLWNTVLDLKPLFEPGSKVRYSDLGYLILGRAIEIAAGMKLDRLASQLLWKPLGMESTSFSPSADQQFRCISNRGLRGVCVDPLDRALGGVVGCDGVFSTAEDLLKFSKMILNKKLLKPESFRAWVGEQTTNTGAIRSDFEYLFAGRKALGWELPGPFSHGGAGLSSNAFGKVGGTGTFLWIDPDKDLVAIYLTNYGQPVPFSADNWSKLIHDVGSKEFFELVTTAAL